MKTTPCPNCGHPIHPAAILGAVGGSVTSRKKAQAARANGRAGGGRPVGAKDSRPRKARGTSNVPPGLKEFPSQIWDRIKGKAHMYKTAYVIASGKCVALVGVPCPGTFKVRHIDGTIEDYGCHELKEYCL